MSIYCEGSAAAEITFSLTAGREGRIMSYNPPVEIFIAKNAKKFSIYKASSSGSNANLSLSFEKILQYATQQEINTNGGFSWQYGGDNTGVLYLFKKIIYKYDEATRLNYYHGEEIIYNSSRTSFFYQLFESEQLTNVFVIQDLSVVLYAHKYPDGLIPTWQVKCIGCNTGECAGSDGQGGVICMDCRQIDRDLQAIKKSLR